MRSPGKQFNQAGVPNIRSYSPTVNAHNVSAIPCALDGPKTFPFCTASLLSFNVYAPLPFSLSDPASAVPSTPSLAEANRGLVG